MRAYLPLSGHAAITSGDTQEESIICAQDLWSNDGVIGFRGSIHLGEYLFRKGFGDSDPKETE